MICNQENIPLWNTNPQHQNALHDTHIETWKKNHTTRKQKKKKKKKKIEVQTKYHVQKMQNAQWGENMKPGT